MSNILKKYNKSKNTKYFPILTFQIFYENFSLLIRYYLFLLINLEKWHHTVKESVLKTTLIL